MVNKFATHLPVLRSVLKLCKPSSILELGPGVYSTRLFYDTGADLVCVENNDEWYRKILETYCPRPGFVVVQHDVGDIHGRTKEISVDDVSKVGLFYDHLQAEYRPAVVFVDQYLILRPISIRSFLGSVDCIVFHDAQRFAFDRPSNSMNLEADARYNIHIDKTKKPHTGVYLSKKFDVAKLKIAIDHEYV